MKMNNVDLYEAFYTIFVSECFFDILVSTYHAYGLGPYGSGSLRPYGPGP